MGNQEQINVTNTFANTVGDFINKEGIKLFMDHWEDGFRIHNSFFVYDDIGIKHYLGEITFADDNLTNFDCFIDGEVIYFLQEKGWL